MSPFVISRKSSRWLAGVVFLVMILWLGSAAAAKERYLGDIRLVDVKGGFRVEIIVGGSLRDYHLFSLPSPPRFVVDLKGRWVHTGPTVYPLENHLIRQVVVGKHSDKIRVVLHLKRLVPPPKIEKMMNGIALKYEIPGPRKAPPPPVISEKEGGAVKRVWLMEDLEGFRMFIETNTPISQLRSYFTAEEPSGKVVMEILGKWGYKGKRVLFSPGKMVNRVEVGRHEGFLRIAVDFAVNADNLYPIVRKTKDGALLEVKWPTKY